MRRYLTRVFRLTGRATGVQQANQRSVTSAPVNINVREEDVPTDYTVDTIGELRALTGMSDGDTVRVNGYYSAGDWGGPRIYDGVGSGGGADNAGTIIMPDGGGLFRWVMRVPENYYNVRWFGLSELNSGADNRLSCRNALSTADHSAIRRLYLPGSGGVYNFITVPGDRGLFGVADMQDIEIFGDGHSLPRYETSFANHNADLVFVEKYPAENIRVRFLHPQANNSALSISYNNRDITVSLETDSNGNIVSTANDVINEWRVNPDARWNAECMIYLAQDDGVDVSGSGVVEPFGFQNLVPKANPTIFKVEDGYEIHNHNVGFVRTDSNSANIFVRDVELDFNRDNVLCNNPHFTSSVVAPAGLVTYKNIAGRNVGTTPEGAIPSGFGIAHRVRLFNCFAMRTAGAGVNAKDTDNFLTDTDVPGIEDYMWVHNMHFYRCGIPQHSVFDRSNSVNLSWGYLWVKDCTSMHSNNWGKTGGEWKTYILENVYFEAGDGQPKYDDVGGGSGFVLQSTGTGTNPTHDNYDLRKYVFRGKNVFNCKGLVGGMNIYGHVDSESGECFLRNVTSGTVMRSQGGHTRFKKLSIENASGAIAAIRTFNPWTCHSLHIDGVQLRGVSVGGSSVTLGEAVVRNCGLDSEAASTARVGIDVGSGTVEVCQGLFENNYYRHIHGASGSTLRRGQLSFSGSPIGGNIGGVSNIIDIDCD